MNPDTKNLIWIDLEMSGLDPDKDKIIEIATIVTNSNLEVVAEGPVLAINQPDDVLDTMDKWNTRQHTKSGLIDRVRQSVIKPIDAEEATLDFIMRYVPPNKSPMCGNSICQDRRFLYRYMPALEQYFHYRNLDVSTLKELAKRWAPKIYGGLKKDPKHLALQDIYDSIEELRYYRSEMLRLPTKLDETITDE